jgi:5-(aminomethyl)-3-furanmethanol phosphate kinase
MSGEDPALPPGPTVVKLGGSLHDAGELCAWLAAVAEFPRSNGPRAATLDPAIKSRGDIGEEGRPAAPPATTVTPRFVRGVQGGRTPSGIVVVPGGGPFADTVRDAQARAGFGDLAAHRMAILAMQQYGLMLQALEPRLGLAEVERGLRGPGAVVWLPWRMVGRLETVEASWDVTSDSLALWLARRIGAPRLVLVKSAPLPASGAAGAAGLAAAGVVDPAFPRLLAAYPGEVRCLGRGDAARLAERAAGLRVLPG